MLKIVTTDSGSGKRTLFLGLERSNIDQMLLGNPILINMEEVGSIKPDYVCLLADETLDGVKDDLRSIGVPLP